MPQLLVLIGSPQAGRRDRDQHTAGVASGGGSAPNRATHHAPQSGRPLHVPLPFVSSQTGYGFILAAAERRRIRRRPPRNRGCSA